MDIQNFIAEFKKTFIYDILCESLEDEQLFEHTIAGNQVIWMKEQTRQMWFMWQQAQKVAVPEGYVVVPKEPSFTTMQRMNESLINNSDETAKYRMQQIYKTMIKAVEQNDE